MAPPVTGHLVRFCDIGRPPPCWHEISTINLPTAYAQKGGEKKSSARTWVDPLHAIWVSQAFREIGVGIDSEAICGGDSTGIPKIISSPSGIGDDGVGGSP